MSEIKTYPEVEIIEGYLRDKDGKAGGEHGILIESQLRLVRGGKSYLIPIRTNMASQMREIRYDEIITEFNETIITLQTRDDIETEEYFQQFIEKED